MRDTSPTMGRARFSPGAIVSFSLAAPRAVTPRRTDFQREAPPPTSFSAAQAPATAEPHSRTGSPPTSTMEGRTEGRKPDAKTAEEPTTSDLARGPIFAKPFQCARGAFFP